ncbi:alpha/beta-Hydrolases superfamily protein [Euphorbia peplus]|nr:alpha/beta-Hydrolases superfamily protein [Euphorbia peplus]
MDFQYHEEYIRNSRGVRLFTCRWLPASSSPKALVFLCHGYGMECSGYMKECGIRLARAQYAVFGIDYEGHGRSSGSRCYIKRFENIVNDCNEFFKSVSVEKNYSDKGRFLYGESMGGAVALLLHKKEPSVYNGAVLAAPMCKISEKLKPHPVVVNILTSFEEIIPKWKIVPTKDVIDSAFKDPVKREEIRNNKLIYQDKPRLKTALEMLRTSMSLERSLNQVKLPFLVLHGDADTVTDPELSKALYEKAGSKDKTIKLYRGMWHGLTAGETEENVGIVFKDIIAWLDNHTQNLVPEPIVEPFDNGVEKLEYEWPSKNKQSSGGSYLCGFREPPTLHSSIIKDRCIHSDTLISLAQWK